MPSFRSPQKQAALALKSRIGIGTSRHQAKLEGEPSLLVHSFGTLRNYTQALRTCARWYSDQGRDGRSGFDGQIRDITPEQAREYLRHRANQVGQKQVDLDRQALEKVLDVRLGRVLSKAESSDRLATRPRAYSHDAIEKIAAHQSPANSLATLIAADAGLRAHELFTIATPAEQPPSAHRSFRADLFSGRRDFITFTVKGKGGLIREICLSAPLACLLEKTRLETPRGVRDRGIWFQQNYLLGAGQSWSQSFTEASARVLGWSAGGHGLRHSHAQKRLSCLQADGFSWTDALEIVSQELGHFRADVTLAYLR